LGVGDDTDERMDRLYEAGARFFCLDVAHGHHDRVIEKLNKYKRIYPGVSFIAGNVATSLGCYDLAEAGADAIKIGIGPGAACTTREVTGFGVPQVSAIMECSLVKKDFPDVKLIADGGIKNSGDIVKALAFGADSVMVGRLLAGVDEAPFPGEYFGNASSKVRDYRAPEGIHGPIERSGSLEDVIKNLTWGIKSGLSYAGCSSIYDLHETDIDYVITSSQSMLETRTRI
jgi:IMP dehydrogenase